MTENNQNSGVIFRESFRGYHKDDVNRYIAQIHTQFSQDSDRMRQEIQRLQNKLHDTEVVKSSLDHANTQIEGLNQKLTACNEIAAEAQRQKTEMADVLAQLKQDLVSLSEKNMELEAEKQNLTEKLSENEKAAATTATLSENEENAKRYEAMSRQIGDIILRAKAEAEEITSEAKVKAAALITASEQQARETELAGIERARQLLRDSACLIKMQNEKYATDCSLLVREMSEKIADIQSRLKTSGDDLLSKNTTVLNDMSRKIPANTAE